MARTRTAPPPSAPPSDASSEQAAPLALEDRVALLRFMHLHRAVESRGHVLYRQGQVPGSYYDSHGQEAIPVGVAYALSPRDRATPLHRDMGVHLVRGTEPARILGQYMGRAGGVTEGRDANLHFGDPRRGCVGMVSALGDMACVALGIATAAKLRGEPRCVATFFGDGATSRGDIHEAMNWAGLHRLPVLFVLEDNQFAYSTPAAEQFAVHPSRRAEGYGFPAVDVDGNDVEAVFAAARDARRRALAGEGPTLLSCRTLRMHGHGAHDDMSYVPPAMLEEWAGRDPIARQEERLRALDVDVEAVAAEVRETIDAATQEALAMPMPSPETPLPAFAEAPAPLGDDAAVAWIGALADLERGDA